MFMFEHFNKRELDFVFILNGSLFEFALIINSSIQVQFVKCEMQFSEQLLDQP